MPNKSLFTDLYWAIWRENWECALLPQSVCCAAHYCTSKHTCWTVARAEAATIMWRRWRRCDDDLAWVTIVAGENGMPHGWHYLLAAAASAVWRIRTLLLCMSRWRARPFSPGQAVLCCDNFGLFFQISTGVFSTRVITKAGTYSCTCQFSDSKNHLNFYLPQWKLSYSKNTVKNTVKTIDILWAFAHMNSL